MMRLLSNAVATPKRKAIKTTETNAIGGIVILQVYPPVPLNAMARSY
jgi:hypothetical protein